MFFKLDDGRPVFQLSPGFRVSAGMVSNLLRNIALKTFKRKALLRPYFATFYLTLRCNFRCAFCDDGNEVKYPDIQLDELDTANVKKVLAALRKAAPSIYFTGGEPLMRRDIVEICRASKELGFFPVSVNTNGALLHRHPELLDCIDYLVVSLNCMDVPQYADLVGVAEKTITKVHDNIIAAAHEQERKRFTLSINCVVDDNVLDGARQVMEFCFANSISFSLVPRVKGVNPAPGLVNNPTWHELIDDVIEAKKAGKPVFNSTVFLQMVKNFDEFECNPTVVPHIYPNGDMFYPCQLLKTKAGNLLEVGDYWKAMQEGLSQHGPIPECGNICHLACYLETSLVTLRPFWYVRNL